MLREWFRGRSHPKEPAAAGSARGSFLSDHWLDLLYAILGPVSESSSGVTGAGESVEDEEEDGAGGGCGTEGGGSRTTGG